MFGGKINRQYNLAICSTLTRNRDMAIKMHFSLAVLLFICAFNNHFSYASPTTEASNSDESNSSSSENDTQGEPQDLYVIKTVVYTIGILTDAANDTDNATQSHEQVDVSFYDPADNGSAIDLSKIPIPIQTNVSGVSVTGLLPASTIGSLIFPQNGSNITTPILPKKQVTVTQNISTTDPETGSEIITNLPKLLGLKVNRTAAGGKGDEDSAEETGKKA